MDDRKQTVSKLLKRRVLLVSVPEDLQLYISRLTVCTSMESSESFGVRFGVGAKGGGRA